MEFFAPDGTPLYVNRLGDGPPLLLLSGGPGCVNYLQPVAHLLPSWTCLLPDPRGVGQSGGGPHDLSTALADIEALRQTLGAAQWTVLGHSWGADLGLAYALAHPERVTRLLSVAGTGIQNDRDWKAAYEAGQGQEPALEVEWNPDVHRALITSWRQFIKTPDLLSRLSVLSVPVTFLHMEADIRPGWPARQLAALLPRGEWAEVPGAPHTAWLTHAGALGAALQTALGAPA
ncbi:alpha/beta fold hydrolase [Deinococcus aquaedulcis]|uniref:alpha/beta fold hydrolase n=1 Tax=Deinococcus aquaedulcis TaxID=2840455 RepID=UPI001C83D101|nr:alpha/beta fold hydrolase [Deinococcus aquaedulcis]